MKFQLVLSPLLLLIGVSAECQYSAQEVEQVKEAIRRYDLDFYCDEFVNRPTTTLTVTETLVKYVNLHRRSIPPPGVSAAPEQMEPPAWVFAVKTPATTIFMGPAKALETPPPQLAARQLSRPEALKPFCDLNIAAACREIIEPRTDVVTVTKTKFRPAGHIITVKRTAVPEPANLEPEVLAPYERPLLARDTPPAHQEPDERPPHPRGGSADLCNLRNVNIVNHVLRASIEGMKGAVNEVWDYAGMPDPAACCNKCREKIGCARWTFDQEKKCRLLTPTTVNGQQHVITQRIVGQCPKGGFKGTVVKRAEWAPARNAYSGPGPCGLGRGKVVEGR